MGLLKKNPFGHILLVKKWLIRILGAMTHRRFRGFNELQIEGSEIIKNLPDILAYVGSISIERTWRAEGKEVNRQVKMSDITAISKALDDGWVITFPQGTTTPFRPIRKGTAHIIKRYKPVVVPIVIDGFRRSFDKKGIRIKKKNILQSMEIKAPLMIDYENETIDQIVEKIEYAIEQHPSFLKVIPQDEIMAQEELNKLRKWKVEE